MHMWTHTIMNCRAISKVDGGCERFDSHENCITDVSYVHVALNTLQFSNVSRDKKNSTRIRSTCWWAVPSTLSVCAHILTQTFIVFKCHELNQEVRSNILDTLYRLQWFLYIHVCVCLCVCVSFFSLSHRFFETQYPPRSLSNVFLCLLVYMTHNCFAWSVDGMHFVNSSDGCAPDSCSDYLPTCMEPDCSPPWQQSTVF